ncbi:AAA family ATPase [Candidatus Microgenomates bacterium]|nr:AAA family ATPase [Candidatus Microgenomates bacterium]
MNKKIIAIVGMAGAGKSEAANFFKEKGFPILRFGDQTDIGLKELGKELTEKNERWYREKLRNDLGMSAYAIKIKPKLDKLIDKHKIIVLDGLYSWEEYEYLKKIYPELFLLSIYAQPKIRYQRLVKRNHRRIDLKDARSRDIAELKNLNKGGPIAIADYLIKNEKDFNDLRKRVKEFLGLTK